MAGPAEQPCDRIYRACRRCLGPEAWGRLRSACDADPAAFPDRLAGPPDQLVVPDYLADLARLEWTRHQVAAAEFDPPGPVAETEINPSLELLKLDWSVCALVEPDSAEAPSVPAHGEEWALVWRDPETAETRAAAATPDELLVLKVLAEDLNVADAAQQSGSTVEAVEAAFHRAARQGLVLEPPSRIRRDPEAFDPDGVPNRLLEAHVFAVQWHITHACDLHCRHCYDRSQRSPLTLEQGLGFLDDLGSFCRDRRVRGHVCFTGGNPFLSPVFFELYRGAADRGFGTSILGNPVPREQVERLVELQRPEYFQVSLEGLPDHNDYIRGDGHFARVIEFLGVLRDVGVSSSAMLTLTNENIDQVLPLAERLRGHTEYFTFNRLSPVGEGAALAMPEPERFAAFLREYVDAAETNPILGFKDNLINLVLRERGRPPHDGCTGFGCGAAFNFVAVLPDGEAHACRKFPSPIGNVLQSPLADVYDSDAARRYRNGCTACRDCSLRPTCGGCLAIASGSGLDIHTQRDPYCFLDAIG